MSAPTAAAPAGGAAGGAAGACAGKRALVTGASRGIGRAIAIALATEGAELVLTARSVEALEETARACTSHGASKVHVVPADCCSMPALDAMAKAVLDAHGAIDVLVCNAGMVGGGGPLDGDPDAWGRMLMLNLEAPMRLTRAFAPAMAEKKSGTIIHIASIAGIDTIPQVPAYCASKWGLRGWSKCCYQALRPQGIKVSCICPGLVDTVMAAEIPGDRTMFIQPEDIAQSVLLVVRMSQNAVAEEIVIRTTIPIEGSPAP